MTVEHLILGAFGFLALCCLWYAISAFLGSPRGKAAVAKLSDQHPLIAAFERFEREGREQAAKELAAEMAAKHAAEFKSKMAGAFAPKSPSGSDAGN